MVANFAKLPVLLRGPDAFTFVARGKSRLGYQFEARLSMLLPYAAPSIEPIVEKEATPNGQRPLAGGNVSSSKAQGREAYANVA
jgi:hypothetical protein